MNLQSILLYFCNFQILFFCLLLQDKIGWHGNNLYCVTHIDTFYLWDTKKVNICSCIFIHVLGPTYVQEVVIFSQIEFLIPLLVFMSD